MTEKDRAKWNQFPHKLVIVMKSEIKQIDKRCFSLEKLMEGEAAGVLSLPAKQLAP
jgi:hypothetical protein